MTSQVGAVACTCALPHGRKDMGKCTHIDMSLLTQLNAAVSCIVKSLRR